VEGLKMVALDDIYKVTGIVAAVGFVGGTAICSDLPRGKTCS